MNAVGQYRGCPGGSGLQPQRAEHTEILVVRHPAASVAALAAGCSLLDVTIKTGRTHQIRVHLAHAGHVIAGDDKYGDFEWNRLLSKAGHKRMFLHAWKLSFLHPATGDAMTLLAPLPPELLAMLPPQWRRSDGNAPG